MWSSWTDTARKSIAEALEKTESVKKGIAEALEKSESVKKGLAVAREKTENVTKNFTEAFDNVGDSRETEMNATRKEGNTIQSQEVLQGFQKGWSSVVENTKISVKKAQEAVEREQFRIQQQIQSRALASRRRDIKLPLDVKALKDAEVVYLTDRIIAMGHPSKASRSDPNITPQRKLAAIGHILEKRHSGKYMIWNLSEVDYDTTLLDDNVLTFSFPGSPAPPLGLWIKILISMESWMKADENNIAVIHCLTGKGRTSTVLASFLCWMGQAEFKKVHQALEYISTCKKIPAVELTIPSQRRYASYFENMFEGIRPNQPPLLLKRIIMSGAPRYARGPRDDDDSKNNKESSMGCAPYLQIFKAGKLIYTTSANEPNPETSSKDLPFCKIADGNITFAVDQIVQGDVLIRCRHWRSRNKKGISMFRAAFHSGYCPTKVFRLTKSQLDGACSDDRFSDDFYLDILLEPCDAEMASKHMQQEKAEKENEDKKEKKNQVVVTATSDDPMLHRDSRFWDVIAQRRKKTEEEEKEAEKDPMWGPTVGRRRTTFPKKAQEEKQESTEVLDTFSIGGGLDFGLNEELALVDAAKPKKASKPKKDSLMEALMALDDEVEEIVFDNSVDEEQNQQLTKEESLTDGTSSAQDAGSASKSSGIEGKLDNSDENIKPSSPSDGDNVEISKDTIKEQDSESNETSNADLEDFLDGDLDEDLDLGLSSSDADMDLDFNDDDLEDLESMLSGAT